MTFCQPARASYALAFEHLREARMAFAGAVAARSPARRATALASAAAHLSAAELARQHARKNRRHGAPSLTLEEQKTWQAYAELRGRHFRERALRAAAQGRGEGAAVIAIARKLGVAGLYAERWDFEVRDCSQPCPVCASDLKAPPPTRHAALLRAARRAA